MGFFKSKPIPKNYPEAEYLIKETKPFSFIKSGLIFNTKEAEVINVYSYRDYISDKLFGIYDLNTSISIRSIMNIENSKVVLYRTKNDKWFSVYYVGDSVCGYSVILKTNVGRIFELNDDRERYEKYINPLIKA